MAQSGSTPKSVQRLSCGLVLGAVAVLTLSGSLAFAGKSKPHTPEPKPEATEHVDAPAQTTTDPQSQVKQKSGTWPKTIDDAKLEAEAKTKPPQTWTAAEIADAKARCAVILKRVHAVVIPQPPLREGECGAPAPVQLISIGTKPEVAISPPATVTCDLIEGLNTWLETSLQPLSRKEFGAEIIKIENMSDYSCRNAYGRAKNKLSEHGRANALDIRGFVTASARTAYVLEGWGKPQREILAEIAAAKAAEERATALKAKALAAEQANQASKDAAKPNATPAAQMATGSTIGAPAAGIAKSTIVDGTPKLRVTLPGARPAAETPAFGIAPDKLGGPKDKDVPRGNVSAFLHQAHDAACQIFGTTLGPEANAAHRNHFHVDMAERKVTRICD